VVHAAPRPALDRSNCPEAPGAPASPSRLESLYPNLTHNRDSSAAALCLERHPLNQSEV
jgi:hypothetical protein